MAQPSIPGIAVGIPRMAYGNDGTDWIAVLVDALGHIQADILSTVLPTDAATQTTLASCLTALQLIDDLRNALGSVNTDDLQVDVKTSALPTDAAKETKQDTMITALQLIDDLRNALGSVNTDDLQVDVKTYPGVNALLNIPFGFNAQWIEQQANLSTPAGNQFLFSTIVPSGEIWVLTFAVATNVDTNPTRIEIGIYDGNTYYTLASKASPGANVWVELSGTCVLKAGDKAYAYFVGCTTNDDTFFNMNGYKMKVA